MSDDTRRHASDIITVPDAPTVPGLIFRRLRGEADYPSLVDVYNRATIADGLDMVATAVDFGYWLSPTARFNPDLDVILAEVEGRIVAYGTASREAELDARVHGLGGRVAPEWRRKGLGRAILRHNERRARTIAASEPADLPHCFQAFVFSSAPGATALLESERYAPVRHFYDMVRDGLADLPDAPLPPGLEVRPVQPAHYRAIWEAEQEAMRDHWGFTPGDEGDYERWLKVPHSDPSLWSVAWDGAEVAGQVLSFIKPEENRAWNRKRGYTEFIIVRKPWRGRGLARALIGLSFQALRARGMTETSLAVDTANESGALRLYEQCGFRVEMQSLAYRKPMT
jgi:GNAT superfamily N-acetyltransferase